MPRASRPRNKASIPNALQRQLNMYTLAASAAGVSVLALAGASEAKVVYTETLQETHTGFPLFIDVNNDGIKDFIVRTMFYRGTSGLEIGLNVSGYHDAGNAVAGRRSSQGGGYFLSVASALPAGARIGPKRKFPVALPVMAEEHFSKGGRSSQYSDNGPWVESGQGVENRYLGLKFVVDGEVHYGWARFSVTLGHKRQFGDVSGTLTGYAYETEPNKPIVAGEIDGADVSRAQPGSLGELALGKK